MVLSSEQYDRMLPVKEKQYGTEAKPNDIDNVQALIEKMREKIGKVVFKTNRIMSRTSCERLSVRKLPPPVKMGRVTEKREHLFSIIRMEVTRNKSTRVMVSENGGRTWMTL